MMVPTSDFFDKQPPSSLPAAFWRSPTNQKRFFEWAASKLRIAHHEGWYAVSREDICELGAARLIKEYHANSFARALAAAYPEFEWQPWRFSSGAPKQFWSQLGNQRRFLDWAATQLGFDSNSTPERWYSVSAHEVHKLGGTTLLNEYYASSLTRALLAVYPEVDWLPWRFASGVPKGFWKEGSPPTANQRRFFDWAAKQLGLHGNVDGDDSNSSSSSNNNNNNSNSNNSNSNNSRNNDRGRRDQGQDQDQSSSSSSSKSTSSWLDGWYRVSAEDISKLGGAGLLASCYEGSLIKALAAVYPEHEWLPWRFRGARGAGAGSSLTSDFWAREENARRFLDWAARELGIRHKGEWSRVSLEQIRQLGGSGMIAQNKGSLYAVLKRVYPEHDWQEQEEKKFGERGRGKRSSQRQLKLAIQKLLPNEEVYEEYTHPDVRLPPDDVDGGGGGAAATEAFITLDIWVPSLSLAFEYHGEQHFHDVRFFGGDASKQQALDDAKARACKSAGIDLISVPYWWDRTTESIAALIRQVRPGIDIAVK